MLVSCLDSLLFLFFPPIFKHPIFKMRIIGALFLDYVTFASVLQFYASTSIINILIMDNGFLGFFFTFEPFVLGYIYKYV